jgi:hypothetical protein
MAVTYEPIATYTVPSAQASHTFTVIPSTYTDIFYIIAGSSSSGTIQYKMQFNSDTASNYSATIIYGTGSTAGSTRQTTQTSAFLGSQSSTDTQGNMTGSVMNYANTTTYKTVISRYNAPAIEVGGSVGLWRSTAAITSITFLTSASTMPAGTTITLYGIKAA